MLWGAATVAVGGVEVTVVTMQGRRVETLRVVRTVPEPEELS